MPDQSEQGQRRRLRRRRPQLIGVQAGTTSQQFASENLEPGLTQKLQMFNSSDDTVLALQTGRVDAIVVDLPTAFYITAVEIPKASIIGQFQPDTGEQEEFGMLFEKGSPLVACVDAALAEMTEDGTLAELETEWLSDTVDVPELQ